MRTTDKHLAPERARETQAGFTLLETLVAMTLFAVGVLGLAQVQFAANRINMNSRTTSTATMLASDRLEEIVNSAAFDSITVTKYPDENYGEILGGDGRYGRFRRDVSIVDTLDITGRVAMKTVTVQVFWQALNGERNISLVSSVARY